MPSAILIATLAGLTAMMGWGLADFFAKKTIDRVGDLATLAWAHIFGVAILAAMVLARTVGAQTLSGLPKDYQELGLLILFGALQAAVYYYVYKGFAKGKLALLNPVFSSYSGIVVLLSIFIFGEVVKSNTLVFLAVIFLGIMLINIDQASFALRRLKLLRIAGMREILVATALAALWTVAWGRFVSGKDWLIYAALMYLFMSVTILVICLIKKIRLRHQGREYFKYFLVIGLAEVLAYVGISIGYSLTSHLSIVAVLSAAFSVPTVILAHVFLKERITRLQVLGAGVVITGVVLISLV